MVQVEVNSDEEDFRLVSNILTGFEEGQVLKLIAQTKMPKHFRLMRYLTKSGSDVRRPIMPPYLALVLSCHAAITARLTGL